MKNVKTPKNATKKTPIKTPIKDVQRVNEVVYNALKESGVNMQNFVLIGTREKTDAKLTACLTQSPKLAKIFTEMLEKREALDKSEKVFLCDNVEYFLSIVLKKTKKQETVK
tara:strand:+ start:649 stop:984 length:336 start_codon:yes stop_codon:yes gene_type:complete